MEGYTRDLLFADTVLTWHAPSPNLPTPEAALLYPATGLLEASNLSVGRGTDFPFAFVGAPWLDGPALARAVTKSVAQRHVRGRHAHAQERPAPRKVVFWCEVAPRRSTRVSPVLAGLSIAAEILAQAHTELQKDGLGRLIGEPRVLAALAQGTNTAELERLWELDLQRFETVRRRYLRSGYCDSDD